MTKRLRAWCRGSLIGRLLTWDEKQIILERRANASKDLLASVLGLAGEGVLFRL